MSALMVVSAGETVKRVEPISRKIKIEMIGTNIL